MAQCCVWIGINATRLDGRQNFLLRPEFDNPFGRNAGGLRRDHLCGALDAPSRASDAVTEA